ncbi:MAG TPA: DUF3826 domain-containing protein [Sedimentisphaerales bacterium]|nr:DUF3826 domain-containing protein [Sedimentisphaerales bacterium]
MRLSTIVFACAAVLYCVQSCPAAEEGQQAEIRVSEQAGETAVAAKVLTAEEQEAAYTATLERRAADILALLKLNDEAKAKTIRDAVIRQYRFNNAWHEANEAKVRELSRNRSDEANAQIEKLRAPLRAQHAKFIQLLEANLTPEQIEEVKNYIVWRKVPVTYNAYLELLPQLTEEQKARILEILKEGREEAMMAGSSEERTRIFGRYKGRVNIYLSRLGINLREAEMKARARREGRASAGDPNSAPTTEKAGESK